MDIGKSFTFMFDDEKWGEKIVIGGLLALASIIPLVNLFTGLVLIGYVLRLLKNVAEGNETPLPAWDDWGGDWVKGLMVALAWGIYSIPIWLASGAGALVDALAQSSDAVGVCGAAIVCLSSLWGLAMGIILPAAVINYAVNGEFASFFRYGDMFRLISNNTGHYLLAIVIGFFASFVASFGVIVCVIGVFFTYFWGTLVGAHLLGQVKAGAAGPKLAVVASAPAAATYGELNEIDLGDDTEVPGKED